MKGAATLLVSVITLITGVEIELNENGCPIDYENEMLYPHKICNKFYQCKHGELIEHICPADLLFNIELQNCEWAYSTECGNRIILSSEFENNGNDQNDDKTKENNESCNCNPNEAPRICANPGSDGTLIANENCKKYYKCANGKPISMDCFGNLHYNPYTKQCDWPDKVECGDRLVPEPDGNNGGAGNGDNQTDENNNGTGNNASGDNAGPCNCNPGEAPSICARSGSDGILVAHENCNQFYKCAHGKPVTLSCYGNLLYNPYTQQCDYPEKVECGERLVPECDGNNGGAGNGDNQTGDNNTGNGDNGSEDNAGPCNCNPGEAPSICARSGSDGILVAHENCNQFYKCAHGKPVTLSCYGNLLYNPYTQQCDYPEKVECGERLVPECDGNNGGAGNGDNQTGDNNNGNGDNASGENAGSCNCNPGEAPSICARSGSDGILVAHENCNQFYTCAHGKPVALSCYGNLRYNPYTQQCDYPDKVECGDRMNNESANNNGGSGNSDQTGDNNNGTGDNASGDNATPCNCNPGEAPSICARSGSDGILVAHENCNQFYKCAHGKPVTLSCYGNLLYNPYTQQCDYPEKVECGDRLVPECDGNNGGAGNGDNQTGDNNNGNGENGSEDNAGSCNCIPGEAPSICSRSGSDGILVAHENCNEFYICTHGNPVTLSCYGNLRYNPYTQQCDYPDKVECGDRINNDSANNNGGSGNSDNQTDDNNNGTGDNASGENAGPCNCNPGEAPSICARSGSDGILVAHENCNQFYTCAHGKPVALSCYGNLRYNPYTHQCDYPDKVECGDRINNDSANNNGGSGNSDNQTDDNNNGNGDNGSEDNAGPCNCNPGEAPSICARSESDGILVAHENCNQFYTCAHGKPVTLSCYGNLLYNPYTQQCDYPDKVECGDRLVTECDGNNGGAGNGDNQTGDNNNGNGDNGSEDNAGPCNCNPGEAPSICSRSGSDGILVAHENCNEFYICTHGNPVTLSCYGNLRYNPYTQQCDYPDKVECGDRINNDSANNNGGSGNSDNQTGDNNNGTGDNASGDNATPCNCNPGEAPSICARSGSDGILVAHENCNQFYTCAHGKPVALSCYGNLRYNPYTQQCDYPDKVECGDRLVTECDGNNGGAGNGDNQTGDNNNGNGDNGSEDNAGSCNCNPGEAPSICARSGSDGILVAHENCNQFYTCAHGKPVTLRCYGNLLYNPYTQQCDYPEKVECGERLVPECDGNNGGGGSGDNQKGDNNNGNGDNGSEDNAGSCNCNPGEAPSICARSGSDGILVAHENCNQFYKCAHGKPVTLSCYGNLLYNPYTQQCDYQEKVECGERLVTECDGNNGGAGNGDNQTGDNNNGNGDNGSEDNAGPCNCNPGEAPSICARSESDGILVAHENCNQFYTCAHGKPVTLSCYGNLLYNPYTQQCDYPDKVECGDRLVTECDGNNGGAGNGDNQTGDNNNGNGDNGSEDNAGPCNCNPGEAPSICSRSGSDGILVAHENCNEFYICTHGNPVTLSCYGNLRYNPYTQQCDYPDKVECGDRINNDSANNNGGSGNSDNQTGDNNNGTGDNASGDNATPCNCNPGEAPSICARSGSDGILVAHENCNQFYTCAHGKPVALSCYGNLRYNPYTQQCDYPDKVECGDRLVTECDGNNGGAGNGDNQTGDNNNGNGDNGSEDNAGSCNCNPGEAPSICARSGSDGILVAHENCNQFYTCAHGKPVTLRCYGNLLYNPYTQQCDYPEKVECGERLVPECDGNNGGAGNGDNQTGDNNNGNGDNGSEDNAGPCNCNPGEAPSICARSGSDGILVAHENCNQFYKCAHGKPVTLSCYGNLLYNPYTHQCDYPEKVECGERLVPECDGNNGGAGSGDNQTGDNNNGSGDNASGENTGPCNCNPGEAPSICARSGSDGILVAHENCNQFYTCAHGKPVALSCYGNLRYNPYTQQCDYPDKVECGDRLVTECDGNNGGAGNGDNQTGDNNNGNGDNGSEDNAGPCNCNPGEAPSICARSGSDGILVAHENCNQFYTCAHGKPVALSCYGNLRYNPYTQQCDYPDKVECGDRLVTECDGNNGGAGNGDNQTGDNNNGNGDNGSEDNAGSCNCNPGEAPSICARSGSDGILVAHENCNQFYKCAHGKPVTLSCYGNLLYNPYTQQCDYQEKVECGERLVPECDGNNGGAGNGDNQTGDNNNGNGDNGSEDNTGPCNCNPGEAPSICARSGSDGILVAHENCNQFYKCAHGKPVTLSCYGNLLYNPYTQQCDYPEKVECGERLVPECDGNNGGAGNGDNQTGDNNNGSGDNASGENTGPCNCNPGEAPSICARSGSDGILVAHENCNQFYKCAHGIPVTLSCYGNLLYNPYTQQCDYQEKVECGDRLVPECDGNNGGAGSGDNQTGDNNNGSGDNASGENTGPCNCNPGEAPSICARSGSDGILVAHENCNQFYKCAHGIPVTLSCYGNLLYNPYTQQCDYQEKVECGDRLVPECDGNNGGAGNGDNQTGDNNNGNGDNGSEDNAGPCNCNPGEAPSICARSGSDGILVAHENCNQFYKCAHGKPVTLSCYGNLLYNPYTHQCDYPEKVECGERLVPECDGNNGGAGSGDNQTGDNNNGSGDNASGENTGPCNCNPGEAPSICARSGSDGILVAHENCNQFYKCAHGIPVTLSCYGNLLYNPYTQQCDYQEKVECGDRLVPECDGNNGGAGNGDNQTGDNNNGNGDNVSEDNAGPCNCNPGEAPSICARSGSDGILVAHENCNQFYKCAHGKPVTLSCYGNLLYNPYTQQCDYPEKVECGERLVPECDGNNGGAGNGDNQTGDNNNGNGDNGSEDNAGPCNCNPGEAPSICARSGSDGIFVAHENCNQFYKCAHGKPVTLSCYENLLYNPYTQQCDYPEKVECGDRLVPECDGNTGGAGSGDNQTGDNNNGNGDNASGENAGSCNCNPGEAPSICARSGSDGILVAHVNCNQFYTCTHGKPVTLSCYGNLLYNPYTQQCDYPEKVECGERLVPECDGNNGGAGNGDNQTGDNNNGNGDNASGENAGSCNCNPGEAPSICARSGSDGILVAHENCNQFYTCAHGKPVTLSCYGNLRYNPYTQQCDYPDKVECGERINNESANNNGGIGNSDNQTGDNNNGNGDNSSSCNCNPRQALSICAKSGSDGILIAHENCNQFFKCSNGHPIVFHCNGDLLYNPYTQRCDGPLNVVCGERILAVDTK